MLEQKTRNNGTENSESQNRKHRMHFLPDFISYEKDGHIAIFFVIVNALQ